MENWLPIAGYKGWYEVSDLGRVRRVRAANNTFVGRILKDSADGRGYRHVLLSRSGKVKLCRVHLLVARAFIGKRPPAFHTNHKDGDKRNNTRLNLEYCTGSANQKHAFRLGLRRSPTTKLTPEQVMAIRAESPTITNVALALAYGVSDVMISNIRRGKSWIHI